MREEAPAEGIRIHAPLTDEAVESLKRGDEVRISGVSYTGRDVAIKGFLDRADKGQLLDKYSFLANNGRQSTVNGLRASFL